MENHETTDDEKSRSRHYLRHDACITFSRLAACCRNESRISAANVIYVPHLEGRREEEKKEDSRSPTHAMAHPTFPSHSSHLYCTDMY